MNTTTRTTAELRARRSDFGEYSASVNGVHFATGAIGEVAEAVIHHIETVTSGLPGFPDLAEPIAECITRARQDSENGTMQREADTGRWTAYIPQPGQSTPIQVWRRP